MRKSACVATKHTPNPKNISNFQYCVMLNVATTNGIPIKLNLCARLPPTINISRQQAVNAYWNLCREKSCRSLASKKFV